MPVTIVLTESAMAAFWAGVMAAGGDWQAARPIRARTESVRRMCASPVRWDGAYNLEPRPSGSNWDGTDGLDGAARRTGQVLGRSGPAGPEARVGERWVGLP